MRIGYEALAWGRHVKDWTTAWDIVRAADRDNLGIVLDSFHICARGNPLAPIADLPGEKSRSCRSPTRRPWRWIRFRSAGTTAAIPARAIIRSSTISTPCARRLSRPAVAGDLQRPVSRRLCASVALDGMRALRAAGEGLAGSAGARRRAARRSGAAAAGPGGRGRRIRGVRREREDAARLVGSDRGPGFSPRRTPSQQGGRPLRPRRRSASMVNREGEGFAHAFSLFHGPSVCALALRVDSIDEALERAAALECQSLCRQIGPGETPFRRSAASRAA